LDDFIDSDSDPHNGYSDPDTGDDDAPDGGECVDGGALSAAAFPLRAIGGSAKRWNHNNYTTTEHNHNLKCTIVPAAGSQEALGACCFHPIGAPCKRKPQGEPENRPNREASHIVQEFLDIVVPTLPTEYQVRGSQSGHDGQQQARHAATWLASGRYQRLCQLILVLGGRRPAAYFLTCTATI
jgi:hypothetical protein